MDSLTIVKRGTTVASGSTSAAVALPTDSAGTAPKYHRFVASKDAYIALGTSSGVTAAAGDVMVQPGDSIVLCTIGFTHCAALQGPTATSGSVQISPVENM